jgi:hypothetical protein
MQEHQEMQASMFLLLQNLVQICAGLIGHISTTTLQGQKKKTQKTWMIQGMRWLESTHNEGKVVLHIHISNSAERVAK